MLKKIYLLLILTITTAPIGLSATLVKSINALPSANLAEYAESPTTIKALPPEIIGKVLEFLINDPFVLAHSLLYLSYYDKSVNKSYLSTLKKCADSIDSRPPEVAFINNLPSHLRTDIATAYMLDSRNGSKCFGEIFNEIQYKIKYNVNDKDFPIHHHPKMSDLMIALINFKHVAETEHIAISEEYVARVNLLHIVNNAEGCLDMLDDINSGKEALKKYIDASRTKCINHPELKSAVVSKSPGRSKLAVLAESCTIS